ncbi:hypothetical protein C9374_011563 [Naegleria lovaniensis]|uniref:Uncharacterized protein n=1 Tax=Naegleria lovaniensis TaxID=51637 RepID=A0AA88GXH6_NAELO|nr:uncharacterized protein C9374_011563 [Naegleria lovaniensis]KAG2392838.1 hypothetical protein C9374_011563 [Naegleria lovaniensis]
MPLTQLPNNNSTPSSSVSSGSSLQRSSTIGANTIMNATTGPYGSASTSALNVGRNLSTASTATPSRKVSQPPVTNNTMISLGVSPPSLSSSISTNTNHHVQNNNNQINTFSSTTSGTPSSSSHYTSKEYEQVNQVFDGLSMSIHQLYHQLKQTQDSIRKISETQQLQLDSASVHSQRILERQYGEDQQKQESLTLEEVTSGVHEDQVVNNAAATQLNSSSATIPSVMSSVMTNTTSSTAVNNSIATSALEQRSFLKNVSADVSSSSLHDTTIFSELQSELTLKNEENATLKLRIQELQHQIETLQKRVASSTYIIEPVSKPLAHESSLHDEDSTESLKEQLATQKEINRIQSVKITNYESAIKLILSRSHDKMEELKRENNTMTELMKKENQTLQALNSKLLNQNIVLKSRLLEVMDVLRDAARQRDLELIQNESVLDSYMTERELLLSLLKISEENGNHTSN